MADLDDDELDDILDSALEEFEENEEEKIKEKEKEKEREKEEKERREKEKREGKTNEKEERDEADDILDEELREQFESFQQEFQDSLKQLTENMQNGENPGLPGMPGMDGEMPSEEELKKLIEGIGEGFGDEEFDKLLSKDVLYEPMLDLTKKYKEWMEKNEDKNDEEMDRAKKQLECLEEICGVLTEGKEDENASTKVQELLEKMEEHGAPPQGIYESCLPSLGAAGEGGEGGPAGPPGEIPPEFEQMMKMMMAGGGEGGAGGELPKDCVIC
eukprot:CAMPEP_0201522230 /NCGR_PEP_ID=MMETSP0161_2-20130828/16550_1 /ASSEMBLY_ACC=CAM_ASM_000251 /TAXON_ID=180227 /ORGANISM="Neoparamoeba aestuarina, Strain SoJaBio B1-5/56/2" /LENGTH=272 /DNA_ID=CAMNT_0047921013 /DNA_START=67 /DNA_END=885 /DNA_ORIENTATION=+